MRLACRGRTLTQRPTNWAGNIAFRSARVHSPTTLEQLQELVAHSPSVRALGTGHSFNRIADTTGDHISVADLPQECVVDPVTSTATVSAGMRYGEVAARLHAVGFALHNLGSLPHISVAGAVATGTHGSGDSVGNLSSAVVALQMVGADGQLIQLSRESSGDLFSGAVLALGALGVVTQVTIDAIPAFGMRQWVYDDLPRAAVDDCVEDILASAYSVSLFTDWRSTSINQVWIKQRLDEVDLTAPPADWLGARLADGPRHPIVGMPTHHCTEQLGTPGQWHERLPHFRMGFTPSSGQELQSEYLLPREHAAAAIRAIEPIRDLVAPLVQISEVRTVAADDLWLSPSYRRATVAIHFTWVPDTAAVTPVLVEVEKRLSPFSPRPHWGKLSATSPETLAGCYERYGDFTELMLHYDPAGKFRNDLLGQWFPRVGQ